MKVYPGTFHYVTNKDYLYNGYTRIDNPEKSYKDVRKAYYQSEIHKLSCSLHAVMTVVSNNYGYMFSREERMEILELAISRGFDPKWGWYTDKAVKCVVDYCNDKLGMDLLFIRIPWTEYKEFAKRGFGIVCGYRQKLGMGRDRSDGTVGEDVGSYGGMQYGHLVSYWNFPKRVDQKKEYNGSTKGDSKFGFVDNYFPKHINNETHVVNLEKMISSGTMFSNGYIVVPRKNTKAKTLQALKQKIKDFRKFFKRK